MKLDTHVVEFSPRLMAVQVDDGGARVLRRKIEQLGVTVHTGKNTTAIVDGVDGTHRMEFADGGHLDADMIVFSAGIRPRDMLARESGLAIGPRGGIEINNNCVTSDPNVYAIGECALWGGLIFGLVAPGYEMARVAAKHMLGEGGGIRRRRHEHQAETDGRGRGQYRRPARQRGRQPLLPVHR
jgi:nitrite reductase (NADH) large subunit